MGPGAKFTFSFGSLPLPVPPTLVPCLTFKYHNFITSPVTEGLGVPHEWQVL